MKKLTSYLILVLILVACKNEKINQLPKIAIAGIAIESSTFSPALSHIEAFHPVTGDTILNSYPFFSEDAENRKRALWFPTLRGVHFQEESQPEKLMKKW